MGKLKKVTVKSKSGLNAEYSDKYLDLMSSNYGLPTLALVKGKGAYLFDSDGKKYLDFLAGIATNALGQAHPAIVKAVSDQVKKISHISNFYINPESLKLAENLRNFFHDSDGKVFFCNSGAEANEAALKISRLSGRYQVLAAEGGFHGRTFGALSLTGQEAKKAPFRPLLKDISFFTYGDIDSLRRKISKKTAMVILEPIQGENGVVVPPVGYLQEVEKLCRKYGVIFALDAVQTGMGRCAGWYGYENEGVKPDIVTLAKGLGGGLPIGAVIVSSKIKSFSAGEHGTTFGGNPIVCAAANAVISTIAKEKLIDRGVKFHKILRSQLLKFPEVKSVRGRGLLIGIVLSQPIAKDLVGELENIGVLANSTSEEVIRIAPPLIITKREIDLFLRSFAKALETVSAQSVIS
jgi:acetylornithine aminotransferase